MGIWKTIVDGILGVQTEPPAPPQVIVKDSLLNEAVDWVRSGTRVDPETTSAMRLNPEDARLMAEAFTGDEGRKRLMIFARMTVLRPATDVTLPIQHQARYADMRQGQDSIFAALVHYLDVHSANMKRQHDDRHNDPADDRFAGNDDRFDPEGSIGVR